MSFPFVREVSGIDLEEAFKRFAALPNCLLLDSARPQARLGRYSFLMADPVEVLCSDGGEPAGLDDIDGRLASWPTEPMDDLPPFQGGIAGLWGYGLARQIERIPLNRFDEFGLPTMYLGLYDVVVCLDQLQGRSWIISQGIPERTTVARAARARQRMEHFLRVLDGPEPARESRRAGPGSVDGDRTTQPTEPFAPTFETPFSGVMSNFTQDAYLDAVRHAIDYIHQGDIFQVNLSQRLLHRAACDSVSLYLTLRRVNPAPFAGYFDLGEHQVMSASPERFLQVQDRSVEARPIKGTRQRTVLAEADLFAGAELRASAKDLAENVMIVDLMRNDLSRVCRDDTVQVTQLCELETYQHVQHLVSSVQGKLHDEVTPTQLLRATFPGGSITGAPKVRAMEIIAELEPTARGAYCGCLGYIGLDGSVDTSILIRTITASRGWWQFPVGGGIVAQSQPAQERDETWHKASGMLKAILSAAGKS